MTSAQRRLGRKAVRLRALHDMQTDEPPHGTEQWYEWHDTENAFLNARQEALRKKFKSPRVLTPSSGRDEAWTLPKGW